MALNSSGVCGCKCERENRAQWWCQIKPIDRRHADLLVKRLHTIYCLNALVTTCVAF